MQRLLCDKISYLLIEWINAFSLWMDRNRFKTGHRVGSPLIPIRPIHPLDSFNIPLNISLSRLKVSSLVTHGPFQWSTSFLPSLVHPLKFICIFFILFYFLLWKFSFCRGCVAGFSNSPINPPTPTSLFFSFSSFPLHFVHQGCIPFLFMANDWKSAQVTVRCTWGGGTENSRNGCHCNRSEFSSNNFL